MFGIRVTGPSIGIHTGGPGPHGPPPPAYGGPSGYGGPHGPHGPHGYHQPPPHGGRGGW